MIEPSAFQHIRFGVNYVPSQRWWFCWNDFVAEEITRDLDAIAGIGADHIRIMLIWPYFQPNPRYVSQRHLDHLDTLMVLAAERKLDVCVTLLTGWLSGWAFRPVFDRPDNFYTAESLREPTELYIRSCGKRLGAHENFLGFDLGNEMNCCWRAAHPSEGDAWMRWALDLCASAAPDATHVNGVDHQPWFYPHTFSPHALAEQQSMVPLHCWIEFTGARRRGGPLDPVCTHLASAMAALARTYADEPAKPIWLQEFGASASWMDAATIPAFLEKSVHASIAGGIAWITWWASHDIQEIYQFDPLEYDLGLITVENTVKPAGEMFRKLAREFGGKKVSSSSGGLVMPLPAHTPEETWAWLENYVTELVK